MCSMLHVIIIKLKYNLTFQTLFALQNIARHTMADTVTVYIDTLCIVYGTGISFIPSYVFFWNINKLCFFFIHIVFITSFKYCYIISKNISLIFFFMPYNSSHYIYWNKYMFYLYSTMNSWCIDFVYIPVSLNKGWNFYSRCLSLEQCF